MECMAKSIGHPVKIKLPNNGLLIQFANYYIMWTAQEYLYNYKNVNFIWIKMII